MTRLTHELYVRLRQAQAILREYGWTQNTLGDELNGYCVYGAICRTGLDGLHVVLRRLAMQKVHVHDLEQFNDTILLNKFEAIQTLDIDGFAVSLERAYGPHWEAVVGLIRQVAHLTPEQIAAMAFHDDREVHAAQYRALLAASANRDTHPFVDDVITDVHLAIPGRQAGHCWAIIDQVAITQLAFDRINRGELSVSIDDLAPANVVFANIIGVHT